MKKDDRHRTKRPCILTDCSSDVLGMDVQGLTQESIIYLCLGLENVSTVSPYEAGCKNKTFTEELEGISQSGRLF